MHQEEFSFSTHQWIPVRTAANRLGISKQRVYQLMDCGQLTSRTCDGVRLVSARSVDAR